MRFCALFGALSEMGGNPTFCALWVCFHFLRSEARIEIHNPSLSVLNVVAGDWGLLGECRFSLKGF